MAYIKKQRKRKLTGRTGQTNTFWRKLRVASKVPYEVLSDVFGRDKATIDGYFSGAIMPDDATAIKICEFFGVDQAEGMAEFRKVFDDWTEAHADTHIVNGRYHKPIKAIKVSVVPKPKTQVKSESITPVSDIFKYLKVVYGKIEYSDFMKIFNAKDSADILEALYGKIDFTTYQELMQA